MASAAVRSPWTGVDPARVVELVGVVAGDLYRAWLDRMARALAVVLVRDLWWARRGRLSPADVESLVTPDLVSAWLVARASIGRAGLPPLPSPDQAIVEAVASFARRNARGLVSKVDREQRGIASDERYWRLLGVEPPSL